MNTISGQRGFEPSKDFIPAFADLPLGIQSSPNWNGNGP
jgi:hypothetical protein